MKRIIWFKDLTIKDVPKVGGKNASLGEMYRRLSDRGVKIPNGFATTAEAYSEFLKFNGLDKKIKEILRGLDTHNLNNLETRGKKIRAAILSGKLPEALKKEILIAYRELSKESGVQNLDVAVRSSATAEDLPTASFAGQQETYLNIVGEDNLLLAVLKCIASLFTNRAISYRESRGFKHLDISLSVGVQKMVRSDKASAGVIFTIDPESGFPGAVVINSSWGLGEMVVKGKVIPDEFQIFKGAFKMGFPAIISRELGSKEKTLIYGKDGRSTKEVKTSLKKQRQFTLTDEEILKLAEWSIVIENYYKRPMDLEWAKDGLTGKLYVVQARPETVHGKRKNLVIENYVMEKPGKLLAKGTAIGMKITEGRARVIRSVRDIKKFKSGEVLVTTMTDPDWEPIMKIAKAIITDKGSRTSHAAIVSRELGIPCIVGTQNATQKIKNDEKITVDCSTGGEGYVWRGKTQWTVKRHELTGFQKPKTKIMVNIGSPDEAYEASFLPTDGVGLAREEFIIASKIKIHPLALINYHKIKNRSLKKKIDRITVGFKNKEEFYVQKLAEGIGQIAAAFYPRPVIVRFSDFKTNEYASLLGGKDYEPEEENPMLGWRGASRYYDPRFKKAFGLECQAVLLAREKWGLKNIVVMIPFCRTAEEAKKVLKVMSEFGLKSGKNNLKVYIMAEVPSNIIEAEKFLEVCDGLSIGSNDLTQLVLGLDRDNADLATIGDERNESVKQMIAAVIKAAKKKKKYIGICGQAPSDYDDFAAFLAEQGIDSISLNPDSVLKAALVIRNKEQRLKK